MRVSAAQQGSKPVVNQEESIGKLPPCVHYQVSDNGSLSSPRVVLDLIVLSIYFFAMQNVIFPCNFFLTKLQRITTK